MQEIKAYLLIFINLLKILIIISMSLPAIILTGLIAYIIFMIIGFHEVSEGYVGIYKKFGVLQKKLAEPGFHFSIPFV